MNRLNRFVAATLVAMALVAAGAWTRGVFAQSGGGVLVLSLDGPLTPAFKLYLERGLPLAAA